MKIKKDMVAVITGGGGGIARAVAQALAVKGCHLALVDISEAALADNKAALSAYDIKITTHITDITSREQVNAMAAAVLQEHGKINILDNNAGITLQKNYHSHTQADWQRIIGINLWGVIYCCDAFLPALKQSGQQEGAHIINMSSMTGLVGLPSQASYSATKAAVRSLSETLYCELRKYGVGVSSVHPGAINTNMIMATIDDSDDKEQAKRNLKTVQKIANSPEYAAEKIIKVIEKDMVRIRIGKDALILDILSRLFPSGLIRRLPGLVERARAKSVKAD